MARAYHIRQSGNELFISTDNNERRKLKADGWQKIDSKDAYKLFAPNNGSKLHAGFWFRDAAGVWTQPSEGDYIGDAMPRMGDVWRITWGWAYNADGRHEVGYLVEVKVLSLGALVTMQQREKGGIGATVETTVRELTVADYRAFVAGMADLPPYKFAPRYEFVG